MTKFIPAPREIPDATGTYPAVYVVGTNENLIGKPVTFRKPSGENAVDEIDNGLHITRGPVGGLINPLAETQYSDNTSPVGTRWNSEGWDNLDKVADRDYTSLYNALNERIGRNIIGTGYSNLVMHDTINNKYYKVQFHFWQMGADNGAEANNNPSDALGGFSYTRQEIFVPEIVNYSSEGQSDPADVVSEHVHLKRGYAGSIYNELQETEWSPKSSPAGVLWNAEGWDDMSNFETREYHPLFPVLGGMGNRIRNANFIMLDVAAKEYYKVKFTEWQQEGGGAWAYTRIKLNKSGNPSGIVFGDGSKQKTANGFIPQNMQNTYENYMLQLSDIGKHVYKNEGDGYAVVIPADYTVNFPIGSAITVVSGDSWTYFNVDDPGVTSLWGAGFNQTSTAYYIPNNSMATLLKIGPNKWMVSGAGLGID